MSKKFLLVAIGSILLVLLLFGAELWLINGREALSPSPEDISYKVPLIIDYSEGEKSMYQIEVPPQSTAFDVLQKASQLHNFELSYKSSDFGVFIESISGRKNGTGGKYWLYYVNGTSPQVAADRRIINPNDTVEFRFQAPSF